MTDDALKSQHFYDRLRDRGVLNAHARQARDCNLSGTLPSEPPAGSEVAELRVNLVAGHQARHYGVVQVTVALRLRYAVRHELIGPLVQRGLELDLLRAAGPHGGD